MSWAKIMAPLSGGPSDAETLATAAALAEPFGGELAVVYAPADAADLMPWMGEGFMGGVQVAALESLKEAGEIGEKGALRGGDLRQEDLLHLDDAGGRLPLHGG
jgi:hypothetical protein